MAQPPTVEPVTKGRLTLHTTAGDILIDLWPQQAPKAVRNIVQLALEGYYEGCEFHRVVPGLCVQTGDATNTGEGGESIYEEFYFEDEFTQRLRFNRRGLVAMANTGKRHTNLSQFFITLDRADALQNKHTIFGTVRGDTYFNVLKISEGELKPDSDKPVYPFTIKSIEVDENPFPDIVPRITAEEKREQDKARREARKNAASRGKKKQGVKNKSLVSFGDEDGGEDDTNAPKVKIGSAHDVLRNDPSLSKETREHRGLPPDMPEGFGAGPSKLMSDPKKGGSRDRDSQSRSKSALDPKLDSAAFATRIDRASEQDSEPANKKRRKTEKDVSEDAPQTDSDRVKAEIAKVQADLMKLTRRDKAEDATDTNGKAKKNSKESGAALLAAERAKYSRGGRSIGKATSGTSGGGRTSKKRDEDEDMMDMLEGFRGKLRAAASEAPAEESVEADDNIDGYAGEILEDDTGDDTGWLSHSLRFRKDATNDIHQIAEYEVIDPRSQGMTLEDAKRQEQRLKRQSDQRGGGRLGGEATARAEQDVRNRERGGGGGNRARESDRRNDRDHRGRR